MRAAMVMLRIMVRLGCRRMLIVGVRIRIVLGGRIRPPRRVLEYPRRDDCAEGGRKHPTVVGMLRIVVRLGRRGPTPRRVLYPAHNVRMSITKAMVSKTPSLLGGVDLWVVRGRSSSGGCIPRLGSGARLGSGPMLGSGALLVGYFAQGGTTVPGGAPASSAWSRNEVSGRRKRPRV